MGSEGESSLHKGIPCLHPSREGLNGLAASPLKGIGSCLCEVLHLHVTGPFFSRFSINTAGAQLLKIHISPLFNFVDVACGNGCWGVEVGGDHGWGGRRLETGGF